jgi:hypothetical protein
MNDQSNYIDIQKLSKYWRAAIGLQQVDGLFPSEYLINVANDNIQSKITLEEASYLLDEYYKQKPSLTEQEKKQEEADKVSQRITELLCQPKFNLSL